MNDATPDGYWASESTGYHQYIPKERAGGNPELLKPSQPGEHVWISICTFRVQPQSIGGDMPLVLDRENLAQTAMGCYVCGQGFRPEMLGQPCQGGRD